MPLKLFFTKSRKGFMKLHTGSLFLIFILSTSLHGMEGLTERIKYLAALMGFQGIMKKDIESHGFITKERLCRLARYEHDDWLGYGATISNGDILWTWQCRAGDQVGQISCVRYCRSLYPEGWISFPLDTRFFFKLKKMGEKPPQEMPLFSSII